MRLTLIDGTSTSEVDGQANKKKKKPNYGQSTTRKVSGSKKKNPNPEQFVRNVFDTARIMFSMQSFGMKDTDQKLFLGHNIMKRQPQMVTELDSVRKARG